MERQQGFFEKFKVQLALAAGVFAGFGAALLVQAQPAQAGIDLGDLLKDSVKVVGIGAVVNKYDTKIDKAVNDLMDNNKVGINSATKVVVIVSPIGNKHIGAAQVVGPKGQVDKVKAVVQLETSFMNKMFRIKGMVPADSQDPTKFDRVEGVGVSAIIDVKI
jgi:hypothetical protein